ncbi:M1 family metallopeptidase [Flexithrix dorotheae]|uniref:M1 family metallopeptidase n=1 Tax=Flexithrix dorotheae TaxID=70993 RepID=UPI000369CCB1|nr:M1 family aminopeptidase [Flexithrix dorotheae]
MRKVLHIVIFLLTVYTTTLAQDLPNYELVSGVSLELAKHRANTISNVKYTLHFKITDTLSSPISGSLNLEFELADSSKSLVLDFNVNPENLISIHQGNTEIQSKVNNGHILIMPGILKKGKNSLSIKFIAGENALNRSEEYLYTLFVPDRASTAFPCFDQPDIKGQYKLTLEIPKEWVAVANGRMINKKFSGDNHIYEFNETPPLSTYLFAFVAGKFKKISTYKDGRKMTMYHRESDSVKVERNTFEIFDLHASSLRWLEEYTQIPMPFEKFEFVLIPSFQYGGMEHVGSILYRSSSLMLNQSATQNQMLNRASLIAHETAHMWFGNLVTMKWFNDVWLKEVFANFMGAKIVNPNFPEINHNLRFLLAHHPIAYSEDRTKGAHPIQQKLDNLKDAGTLYGRIIYQKSPIVMQQLEKLMGEKEFREGLQEYLKNYSFSNAVWDDLITILDKKTDKDLKAWSEVWVKESGMPAISVSLVTDGNQIKSLKLKQRKSPVKGNIWQQKTEVVLVKGDSIKRIQLEITEKINDVEEAVGWYKPDFILSNGDGLGYGFFTLGKFSREFLLKNISSIKDPMLRGVGWISLYEEMLNGHVPPDKLMATIIDALPQENEALNSQNILGYLNSIYWKFYKPKQRKEIAVQLENTLWKIMNSAPGASAKSAYFRAYKAIALSEEAITRLKMIWERDLYIDGLILSERDYISIACELALRSMPNAEELLIKQINDTQDPNLKERLSYAMPALSDNQHVRDDFFESLRYPENRHYEPWVVESLSYLHHPLRAKSSEKYIRPSLELLEEIQRTGDIFFPKQWLIGTFSGHQSKSAANTVKKFLKENPEYPYRLKNKVLQAADMLFRAADIVHM